MEEERQAEEHKKQVTSTADLGNITHLGPANLDPHPSNLDPKFSSH